MTKLTRIWKPLSPLEEPVPMPWQTRHVQFKCVFPHGFNIEIQLAPMQFLPESICLDGEDCQLEYDKNHGPQTRCHYAGLGPAWPSNWPEIVSAFADEYMPLFRRNCWLSGCPLECTAHEKIEWWAWYREQRELL